MLRRATLALAVAAALAVPLAGCGKTAKEKYVGDFSPLNDKLLTLGNDLAVTVNGVSDAKPGRALRRRFEVIDGRFGRMRRELRSLDTPQDLRQESQALDRSLGSLQHDVTHMAAAAGDGNPGRFRTAATALSRDAKRANEAQQALAKAAGLKLTTRTE